MNVRYEQLYEHRYDTKDAKDAKDAKDIGRLYRKYFLFYSIHSAFAINNGKRCLSGDDKNIFSKKVRMSFATFASFASFARYLPRQ
jgi:hypothetical protein